MFHHDAAYEAALRALDTAAYVRPFVLYFNLMDHARAPLPAEKAVWQPSRCGVWLAHLHYRMREPLLIRAQIIEPVERRIDLLAILGVRVHLLKPAS
jgi:hypothetical protein